MELIVSDYQTGQLPRLDLEGDRHHLPDRRLRQPADRHRQHLPRGRGGFEAAQLPHLVGSTSRNRTNSGRSASRGRSRSSPPNLEEASEQVRPHRRVRRSPGGSSGKACFV